MAVTLYPAWNGHELVSVAHDIGNVIKPALERCGRAAGNGFDIERRPRPKERLIFSPVCCVLYTGYFPPLAM